MTTRPTDTPYTTNKRTIMDGNSTSQASQRLATIVAVMTICLGLVAGPQSYGAGSWPNEPAGFSVKVDCPFSGALCPGIWNAYNTADFAADAAAPLSPSTVFDTFVGAGSSQGNGQWGVDFPNVKEVYVGLWWKTNPEFQGTSVNTNKMFFIRNANIDNSFMSWHGAQDQPRQLVWYMQALYDNCHVSGYVGGCFNQGDGTGWFTPNVNGAAATIRAGSGWHRIEVYQKSSTTTTSRDGTVRWWVDGTLVGNYTNVNLTPPGFADFQINHSWDGSIAMLAPYRDMTRAWHHYWDHLHISVGSGAGSADQPPGPPATPTLRSITVP